MNGVPVGEIAVISAKTSQGASTLATEIVQKAMRIAVQSESEPKCADTGPFHDYMFSQADEGFPTRKPGNAQTRSVRKAKKKMQKMSRRANR